MRFLRASSTIAARPRSRSTTFAALAPRAEGPKVRFSVTYGAAASATPLDGRLLLLISKDPADEPRLQITRQRAAKPAGLRRRRRGLEGRRARRLRGRRPRLSGAQPGGSPRRHVPRPGAPAPLRDVPARRRPRRQAPDGSRRGPAVEQGSRQPLLDAEGGRDRSREGRDDRDRPRPGHPADPGARDHEVRQAREAALASGSRSSGAVRCTSARTSCCPRATTRTRTPAIPSSSTTATFPDTIGGWREEPPDPNLAPEVLASGFTGRATTAPSRSSRISSTRTGPRPTIRATSSSRSSTPTRTTTTRTR